MRFDFPPDLFRRAHLWIALIFAAPFFVVFTTGVVLSLAPVTQALSISPGELAPGRLAALIVRHDPDARASGLLVDHAAGALVLEQAGKGGTMEIDLQTGEIVARTSMWRRVVAFAKELHRRFFIHTNVPTLACGFAMLGLAALGLLMGFVRPRNNPSGWHKTIAWIGLPVLVLSPLTGVLDGLHVTFGGGNARVARSESLSLVEALGRVEARFDPATIYSVSSGRRGGFARVFDNGELRGWTISRDAIAPAPGNWPRAIHEGTWSAVMAGGLNLIASLAMLALLATGLLIWSRRMARRRANRARGAGSNALTRRARDLNPDFISRPL